MNTPMKLSKKYYKPTITTIILDNEISLILCSDNDGNHHGHHGHRMPEYDEEENNESPFN